MSANVKRITIADEATERHVADLHGELVSIAKREFTELCKDNADHAVVLGTVCSVFLNVGAAIQFAVRFSNELSDQQIRDEANESVRLCCEVIAKRMRELE